MRRPINLSAGALGGFALLVHGGYGAGKTHFLGDALRTEQDAGPVAYLNMMGEDGYLTLSGMGLKEGVGLTLETYQDIQDWATEAAKSNYRLVAIDSLKAMSRIIQRSVTGGVDRPLRIAKNCSEWSDFHFATDTLMRRLVAAGDYVIAVCPSDRSVEQLSGQTFITPDLPGRQAAGVAEWFDFVAYLHTPPAVVPGAPIRRKLTLTASDAIIARQRVPVEIKDPIDIPVGAGGWDIVKKTFLNASSVPVTV